MSAPVLVTGGAGYIGSHAVLALLRAGRSVVVVDNLCRGHREALDRIRAHVPGAEPRLVFVEANVADRTRIAATLRDHAITDVLHFAAFAIVSESVADPLAYYRNNVAGSLALLGACMESGVERFIFSSSAATYGIPDTSEPPIREDAPQNPVNPYGRSKLAIEWALADCIEACQRGGRIFAGAALRYFNVAGCDRDGVIGEDHDPESHLIPVIIQHLLDRRDRITIYGDDYDTPDGTCIRDYIHVEDLIGAHLAVLDALGPGELRTYNLGIGRGYSVRQIVDAAERVVGRTCAIEKGPRRSGDPPTLYADASLIQREIGWRPGVSDIDTIIRSAWGWFAEHPSGCAAGAARGPT